jgi:uncharacterized protein YbjT (DUF2867 family)
VSPSQEGAHLVLDGALEDELGTQATELSEAVGVPLGVLDQAGDGLFQSGAWGGMLLSRVQSSLSVF